MSLFQNIYNTIKSFFEYLSCRRKPEYVNIDDFSPV